MVASRPARGAALVRTNAGRWIRRMRSAVWRKVMLRIEAYGAALVLLVVGAVACGDDEDTNAATSTGQATSSSSSTGAGATGSGGAGSGGAGGVGVGGAGGSESYPRVGTVIASSYDFAGTRFSSVSAAFGRTCTSNDL